ncbi:hypothetical protein HF521_014980 [Silurus meridionalis]|uniref:Uncharacterized protein n=1 Tax=Silurus meridionalis TaxID=175797 RepID=A0A8T0A9V2_SILME|nr:hypothetical protein HF521_014980 [Silurus meridionalis]
MLNTKRSATVRQKQDSYLKRYLRSLPQEKRRVLENSLEAACISEAAAVKVDDLQEVVQKEKHSEEDQGGKGDASGGKKVHIELHHGNVSVGFAGLLHKISLSDEMWF